MARKGEKSVKKSVRIDFLRTNSTRTNELAQNPLYANLFPNDPNFSRTQAVLYTDMYERLRENKSDNLNLKLNLNSQHGEPTLRHLSNHVKYN